MLSGIRQPWPPSLRWTHCPTRSLPRNLPNSLMPSGPYLLNGGRADQVPNSTSLQRLSGFDELADSAEFGILAPLPDSYERATYATACARLPLSLAGRKRLYARRLPGEHPSASARG